MDQAVILKSDLAVTSNSGASQKQLKNNVVDADKDKAHSFSSTLDKLDKQAEKQNHREIKKSDKSDKSEITEAKTSKADDHEKTKADTLDEKDGKLLPDDTAVTDENGHPIILDANATELPFDELAGQIGIAEDDHTELSSEDAVVNSVSTPVIDTAKVETKAVSKEKAEVTQTYARLTANNQPVTNINASNEDSAELTNQEGLTVEQKQQGANLRSDILNAILKKTTTDADKIAAALSPQKIPNNPELTPANLKDGLSEEQKMIALANIAKPDFAKAKSQIFGAGLERNSGTSLTTFSQPAINTNVATASVSAEKAQPTLDLQPAIQSAAWNRVLSSRVIWMAREGVQQASLKMNPANLGPVEVKLHMQNDQASVSFVAHHAATRDALEQALPRLRESFLENQMELAHADVSQQSFSQAEEQENNKTTNNGSITVGSDAENDSEASVQDAKTSEQDLSMGLSVFA